MLPVGYYPCTQDPPRGEHPDRLIDELLEQAETAEASGFDGFYFTEHHQQEDAYLPAPVLMAGLVGMRTSRMRVGTCVLLMPLYHPVRLAEDTAVVDQATKGRLVVAAGIGYQQVDFDAFGVDRRERARRTEEGVEILRRAWTGQPFDYEGRHHRIESVRVTPKPYQVGGPPIWMAAWSPEGLARAARIADGWIVDPIQSLEVVKRYADAYREAAARHGRKPFVCLMRDAIIADSRRDAEKKSGPTLHTHRWYLQHGAYVKDRLLEGVDRPEDLSFDVVTRERVLAGTPDECLAQLETWNEVIRPDYLMVRMRQPGGPPQAEALRDIRLFGEGVIPRL
jgi:alkanesulfonate monooxygenase SsuD/methylene tetrahydromethanopterin reductase-like flavin-dependent oxidoreductase (luciferase family)